MGRPRGLRTRKPFPWSEGRLIFILCRGIHSLGLEHSTVVLADCPHLRYNIAVNFIPFWLLCALFFNAACAPLPAAPKPPTLAQVLAGHRRAVYVSAAAARPSPTLTVYAIEAAGLSGTLSEWSAPGGKSRTEMILGPIKQTEGDDGQTLWQQDMTGHVRLVRGTERAASRASQSFSLEAYDPLRGDKTTRVSLRPKRDPATGDLVVDVAPAVGTQQTLFLDPKTFLVRKMVASKGGLSGTIQIDEYAVSEGERVPSRLRIRYAGVPLLITARLVQARRLAAVDAGLFAPPASASDAALLSHDGKRAATVSFDFSHGEVTLPVSVNGHLLHLVLDSGAATSFVTGVAAAQIGLTTQGQLPAVGYGGASLSGVASGVTLEIMGAARLTGQSVYVLQDPAVAKILSERGGVDGGLGYDVLARLVTTIDYAHKTVSFALPGSVTPPANATVLPVTLEGSIPLVDGRVDGKGPGRFTLDTGDGGALHLYAAFARANGLLVDKTAPGARTVTGAGIGGLVTETVTPGHTLSLGGLSVPNLLLATSEAPGVSSLSQLAGGIGNAALGRFVVTFDYPNARVWLVPAHEQDKPTSPSTSQAPPAPQFWGEKTMGTGARFTMPVETQANQGTVTCTSSPQTWGAGEASLLLDLPASPTTQDILAKHLAAIGGAPAVQSITSTRIEMTVQTGGLSGTVLTVYAAPQRERQEIHLGILSTTDGCDGTRAWRKDSNGNVRLLGDDERRELRLQLFLDTYAYALPGGGRIGGTVSLRPGVEAGTGDYILDVTPTGGKPSALYLDPETFLVVKEQHLDDDRPVTTFYSDYRAVNGVQFPFAQRTTNGTDKYDVISHVTSLVNNGPVDNSLFTPPAANALNAAQFAVPGAKSATVPFDFDDGEIGIPVLINGKKSRVFLDSGASGFALSQTVADTMHLKQQGVLEARGYGGSTDLHPVKIDTLEIPGAVRLMGLTAVSIALPEGFDQSLSQPVSGFIGYDLLSRYVVKIDYAHRTLTFSDPAVWTPFAADGPALPLNLDSDVPSVQARLDYYAPASFLLDTGDESALRLYGPYVAAHGLRSKYPKQTPSVGGGIGGQSRSSLTRVGQFTVAGQTLRSVPTDLSLDTKGGASQIFAGALGGGLLSRFTVTFDYPHSRVFLAPTQATSLPFDLRTSGVTVAQVKDAQGHARFVVADVTAGTPAARAGVLLYDQILRVDGQDAGKLTLPALRGLLSAASGTASHLLLLQTPQGTRHTARVTFYDPLS